MMNYPQTRVTALSTGMRATAVVVLFAAALLSWRVQAAPRDEASKGLSKTSNLVLVENGVSRAPIVVSEAV